MEKNSSQNMNLFVYLENNDSLKIPSFQRDYSWEKPQIIDLWEDLTNLIEDIDDGYKNEHFFGQIITYDEDGVTQIIDGQQRITTTFLFLGALKDVIRNEKNNLYKKHPANENVNQLQKLIDKINELLFVEDGFGEVDKSNIRFHLQDDFGDNLSQRFFETLLSDDIPTLNIEKKGAIKNLDTNYNKIKSCINEYIGGKSIDEKYISLKKIFSCFARKFEISIINGTDKLNAFLIFETVNARGKELSSADIIKSHLLSFSNGDDEFDKTWADMKKTLGNEKIIAKFVRSYVWAKYSSPTAKELFRVVSKEVKDHGTAEIFINELFDLKDIFNILVNSTKMTFASKMDNILNSYRGEGKKELIDVLLTLKSMKEELHYPLVLSLFKHGFSTDDMLKIMNKIRSLIMRNNIICGDPNNSLTRKIAELSQKIWNASTFDSLDVEGILNEISSWMYDDNMVIANYSVTKFNGAEKNEGYAKLTYCLFEEYIYSLSSIFGGDEYEYYYNLFKKNDLKLCLFTDFNESNEDDNNTGFIGEWTFVEPEVLKKYKSNIKVNRRLPKEHRIEILNNSKILVNKKLAIDLSDKNNEVSNEFIKDRSNKFSNDSVEIWR